MTARRTRGRLRRLTPADRHRKQKRDTRRARVAQPPARALHHSTMIARLQVQLEEAVRDRDEYAQRFARPLLAFKVKRIRRQLLKAWVAGG